METSKLSNSSTLIDPARFINFDGAHASDLENVAATWQRGKRRAWPGKRRVYGHIEMSSAHYKIYKHKP